MTEGKRLYKAEILVLLKQNLDEVTEKYRKVGPDTWAYMKS